MESETARRGWRPLRPPVLRGQSGVEHTFGFVVAEGDKVHAFDFCEVATEHTLVAAFAKKFDTGVDVSVLSFGKPTEGAKDLSDVYEIDIVSHTDVRSYFDAMPRKRPGDSRAAQRMGVSRALGP